MMPPGRRQIPPESPTGGDMTDDQTTATAPTASLRELLFADLPAAEVEARFGPPADRPAGADPNPLLAVAAAVRAADGPAAEAALAALPADAETRLRLQAWAMARSLGVQPRPAVARQVLGVVVDAGFDAGTDSIAGYFDGSARYLNQGGGGVFHEASAIADVNDAIAALLVAGQAVADATGPLDGPRPPAPGEGGVAIWLLTPAGIHLGMGPFDALTADPLGGPVIRAAIRLMGILVDRSEPAGA
jgi:hypothetical protein